MCLRNTDTQTNNATPKQKLKKRIDMATSKIYKLLDNINRSGISNAEWGVCKNITDCKAYFGAKDGENVKLEGEWLYVMVELDDTHDSQDEYGKADRILWQDEYEYSILLYKL